ncbi:sensor histidine kinase [Amycolatopsis sulphurea]
MTKPATRPGESAMSSLSRVLGRRRPETEERLWRLNIATLIPPLAVVGVMLVVLEGRNWWQILVLSCGLLAGLAVLVDWSPRKVSVFSFACLGVSAAVWAAGSLVMSTPTAFYGFNIACSLIIPELRQRRGAVAVGMICFVGVFGLLHVLVHPGDTSKLLVQYVVIPTGVTMLAAAVLSGAKKFYDLVQELDVAREREAELAVMRERMRFASDLHDIQGHTLHVVKLKVTLAEKLLHRDLYRAQEELREVHALVGDTIMQTKELAYAQRRLNLATELENAKNLFEAAGIHVRIVREPGVEPRPGELLGQVLRETTTNILRHAQARQVHIVLSASGISIVNDGAQEEGSPELRGLSTLSQRVADDGGELKVAQQAGRFLTAAGFPRVAPGTVPMMTGEDPR